MKAYSPIKGEFEKAIDVLRSFGASVVYPAEVPSADSEVLTVEFKVGINKCIRGRRNRPQNVNKFADLIRFGNENKGLSEPYHTDQSQ